MSAVVSGDTARNIYLSPRSERGWNAADEAAALASPWFKGGGAGWLVVGTLVVAWDLTAPETLSAAFSRARSDPVGSAVIVVVWAFLTGHLFEIIPGRADPFRGLMTIARKAVKRGSGQAMRQTAAGR
jgi:hypothetical protein